MMLASDATKSNSLGGYVLKWIRCAVEPTQREAFDLAQRAWSVLATVPGFLFQVGGWDTKHKDQAAILGAWESQAHYEAFMSECHDRVTSKNLQSSSYTPVLTRLFSVLSAMPGAAADGWESFVSAEFIRVAHCVVHAQREEHFRSVQTEIWAPGMAAAGMEYGFFAKEFRKTPEFLVCSAWSSEHDHTKYMESHFPALRTQAEVESDVNALIGSLVRLEPNWIVKRA